MITLYQKRTLEFKQVTVNEWLKFPETELEQWDMLYVSGIVRVFYYDRPYGLFEKTDALALLEKKPNCYNFTEITHMDEIALRRRRRRFKRFGQILSFGKPRASIRQTA